MSNLVSYMKVVKVADAKNHLSKHLGAVKRGARIRIFDRNTPIADLVPVELSAEDGESLLLAKQEARGILRRGAPGPLPAELFRPGPADPGGRAVAALLDERKKSR